MTDSPVAVWEHEDASVMLIDHMYDKMEEQILKTGLDKKDFNLVKALIKGDSSQYVRGENSDKAFLFDIVANKRNSFDIDKLDYLNRDLKHTNINSS